MLFITGTYQGVKQVVTHPIESAKSLASNPGGALKTGISNSTNMMASVAAFPGIAGASLKKGDATVAGNNPATKFILYSPYYKDGALRIRFDSEKIISITNEGNK